MTIRRERCPSISDDDDDMGATRVPKVREPLSRKSKVGLVRLAIAPRLSGAGRWVRAGC
jgi:hypothetical protein